MLRAQREFERDRTRGRRDYKGHPNVFFLSSNLFATECVTLSDLAFTLLAEFKGPTKTQWFWDVFSYVFWYHIEYLVVFCFVIIYNHASQHRQSPAKSSLLLSLPFRKIFQLKTGYISCSIGIKCCYAEEFCHNSSNKHLALYKLQSKKDLSFDS